MRYFLSALLVLMAGGCSSDRTPGVDELAKNREPSCVAVAQERARDASYNGLDESMQAAISRDAYNSCVAFRLESPRGPGLPQ